MFWASDNSFAVGAGSHASGKLPKLYWKLGRTALETKHLDAFH
jgi:hypothetical protein